MLADDHGCPSSVLQAPPPRLGLVVENPPLEQLRRLHARQLVYLVQHFRRPARGQRAVVKGLGVSEYGGVLGPGGGFHQRFGKFGPTVGVDSLLRHAGVSRLLHFL